MGAHVPDGMDRERRQHLWAHWGCQTLAEVMENAVWWLLLIYWPSKQPDLLNDLQPALLC